MTLEEKIRDIISDIHCDTNNWGECGGTNRDSQKSATKELLLLILQEKVELLEDLRINKKGFGDSIEYIQSEISELNNQILNLKS